MGDAMRVLGDDAFNWWWIRRNWDLSIPNPRRESAMRIEETVYDLSEDSFPAFRALVESAEGLDETLHVVEAFYEFLPWSKDGGGRFKRWLTRAAEGEPSFQELIRLLDRDV